MMCGCEGGLHVLLPGPSVFLGLRARPIISTDTGAARIPIKPGGGNSDPIITEYQRAATGNFTAIARNFHDPTHYQWKWSGTNISGQGTLPGTTASFNITGNTCRIQTAMGEDLAGELAIAATDALGKTATASSRVAVQGTEIHVHAARLQSVVHPTQPIQDELADAISHGMGVSRQSVLLR